MIRQLWLMPLLMLTTINAGVAAAQQQTLAWTALDRKKPFVVEVKNTSVTKSTINDYEQQEKAEWTHRSSYHPQGIKNGKYIVLQRVHSIGSNANVGGKQLKGKWQFPLNRLPQLTLIIDPATMRIEKIQGADMLARRLAQVIKVPKKIAATLMSESTLTEINEDLFRVVPPRGVIPPNKTWTNIRMFESKYPMQPTRIKIKHAHSGTKNGMEAINTTGEMEILPMKRERDLPFTITKTNFTSRKYSGRIFFNSVKGRLESSVSTTILAGTIHIRVARQDTSADFEVSCRTEIRVKD